jgi:hypothetical protein
MGEVGCSKDGSFQNLEVNGFASINNTKTMNQQKVIYATVQVKNIASVVAEDEKIFWLPPRSIITAIDIVCVSVPTTNGTITIVVNHQQGQTVGQSQTGAGLLLTTAATNVPPTTGVIAHTPAGIFHSCTLVATTAGNLDNPNTPRRSNVSTTPKPIYLRVINTAEVTGAGTFAWIISYKQF